ncbi:probable RNA-dependent RNA polymerase 1 isoform X2 [Centruroides sculpturatus]|uniref:probable RNA-dependent RNA polymerase 1 isoform X2 n=1 Tax=Centruroides sculpturatus TaxID=218467 RepID=UPI000C6D38CD|nr:probable RNA-dependent RNA polymerase 1 isoform X2 [Centruroides sculpturatus]
MGLKFLITRLSDYSTTVISRLTLENHLQECGFSVLEWVEMEKTDTQDDKPTFDERIIQVECVSERLFTDLFAEIDMLTTYWCRINTNCWLTFMTPAYFHQTRVAYHENVDLSNFYYGTLISQTQCVIHRFHRYVKGLLSANFYHDMRILEMKYRVNIFDKNNTLMTIKYSSIRRIILNVKRNSASLFLDIKYPPVAHSRGRRVLTFYSADREVHGKATVLVLRVQDVEFAKEIVSRFHSCNNAMPIHYGSIKLIIRKLLRVPSFELSNFDCTYNLFAILTRSFLLLEQTRGSWKTFIDQLEQQCEENSICLAKALEYVLDLQEHGILCHYPNAIRLMYHWYCKRDQVYVNDNEYIIPPNTKPIRRVVLTPTKTLFYPPKFQFSNRILRNFNADYALRVSFRDDDNKKLSGPAKYSEDALLDFAVTIPVIEGIRIGTRHYKFLAWSNSQIRDHGIWMYAEDDKGNNTDTIRTWMGDFSITNSVSKYMARLGQCFSHTEDTVEIPLEDRYVITEDDIEGGNNPITEKPYCFSDGVGKMSRQLAENVSEKLELKKVPSAFQIRYAGYKGMLVTDPALGDVGLKIVFRKSMKKFDSPSNQLEIIKKSQAVPVQLNRPMINILNQIGVPNKVFMKLQEEMLSTITDILTDDEKAAQYLTFKLTLKTMTGFKEMVNVGISLTGDPFFRGLLLCFRERAIYDVMVKARLAINPNEGRNMFGVLDETATLEYGQVFIQYTKDILDQDSSTETVIKTGRVLVTKNPCIQPGDIRMLEAIDVPALHHIVDCIVFPQKGNRPHPDEMAGSDLDGDEYAVIWKKELFFSHNREPENFPSLDEDNQSHALFNVFRAAEILKEYIKNDEIGTIGNAHLAISDRYGINFPVCKQIARKFSLALDYVKTGHLEPLTCEEKPYRYPDFMERGTEKYTYSSERALGDLYRYCKTYVQKITSIEQEIIKLQIDPDLIYPGWEKYEESASISRQKYNHFLQILMRKYGIQTETEIISGAFRKLHELHAERNDASDVEKLIVLSVETLQKRFRKEFHYEFGISEYADDIDPKIFEDVLKKASACSRRIFYPHPS